MADENNTPTPTPDYAGYPSPDELVKGYRNSSAEAKRLAQENQRLQETLQGYAANQRQDIPQRQNAGDRLAEFGIPADALNDFVNERVGQALAPLAAGFQARGRVLNSYPDYTKYEAEVAEYVNSDPEFSQRYAKMFSADPVGAMELAFLKFGETKRHQAPPPAAPNAQEMADASLPGERAGESRRSDDLDSQVRDAYEQMQKSGNEASFVERFAKLRLRQAIPDSFFEKNQ
jgi:hypothetical protein